MLKTIPMAKRAATTNKRLLYLFLLFATRMNMRDYKVQAGLDATRVFEHICCEVARRFWGGPAPSVHTLVFGTARTDEPRDDNIPVDLSSFEASVTELCQRLSEGVCFRKKTEDPITAKDDKLDVVVWRRFADQRTAQLIGFGQCKTGTNWEHDLSRLQPRTFYDNWMHNPMVVDPIRLYFVTDRVRTRWVERCKSGGIIFDRCRIVEYSDAIPKPLETQMVKWTKEVMKQEKLNSL